MAGLAAAVAGGMGLDHLAPWSMRIYLTAGCAAWLVAWLARRRGRWTASSWLLALSAAGAGAARHHDQWHLYGLDHVARYATETPRPVLLQGMARTGGMVVPAGPEDPLSGLPSVESTRADIEVQAIRHRGTWRRVRGRARLICRGPCGTIQAGDRLRVVGLLMRLPPAANPGQWDPLLAGRARRQVCRVVAPEAGCIRPIGRVAGRGILARWRARGDGVLLRRVPRHGELAAALLLGSRERLAPGQLDALLVTGTFHLLAISGLHVGILASGIWAACRLGLLRRSTAVASLLVGSIFYSCLTGSEAPIVRAAAIVQLACLAWLVRRPFSAANALAAAAVAVLALRPADLFRAGPQLSFLAVAALVEAGGLGRRAPPPDPVRRLLWRTRPWYRVLLGGFLRMLGHTLAASVAVWLVTLPLVAARFHLVSWSAPVASAVLGLPMAAGLFAALGVVATDAWFPAASEVLGSVCDICLDAMLGLAQWIAGWPFLYDWVLGPGGIATAVGYALALLAVLLPRGRWPVLLLAALVPLSAALWRCQRHPLGHLECWFLSVGHGNCVVLRLPSGRTVLFDAGHRGPPRWEAIQVCSFLWSQGIAQVDAIAISHADADHFNMVPELVRRMECPRVYVARGLFSSQDPSPAVEVLATQLARAHVDLRALAAGATWSLDPTTRARILHPGERWQGTSDNANSLVAVIEHRGQDLLLLPGDIEPPGMDRLLALPPIRCAIAMTPHHGNFAKCGRSFAAWCRPGYLVTSGSASDWQRALRQADLPALPHWCTSRDGAVHVVVDANGWSLDTHRPP